MAAWHWLDKQPQFSLFNYLRRDIGKHSPRKNAFLAFYVRTVFGSARSPRLNDVFAFREDFAGRRTVDLSWQEEEFELVTLSSSGKECQKISVVTTSSAPCANFGLVAKTNDDVLQWISENRECHAVCFPTEDAGPDLFFYIRSKKTQSLLLVAVQAKNHSSEVRKSDLIQGVRTVTPSWFWKSKDLKFNSSADIPASDIASSFHNTLLQIKNGITVPGALYPVLRVFASWPADAQIERTLGYKESRKIKDDEDVETLDSDPHPLAVLHKANFQNINEKLDESWYSGVQYREVVFKTHECFNELRKSPRKLTEEVGRKSES